jgi:cytochrome b
MNNRILVWDLPTRIFHWSLAVSFAVAFLTAESERWRDVHVVAGYLLLGLLAFRLTWGLIGSRYARFTAFVRGPQAILRYLRSVLNGRPEHHAGHNPAGAVAIVALIGLGIASGVSGWLLYDDIGGESMEELHEVISNAMLAVVVLHIAGVLIASRLHRENLVWAMMTGKKRGDASEAIPKARGLVALLLVAGLAGSLAWAWSTPLESRDQPASGETGEPSGDDEDDE